MRLYELMFIVHPEMEESAFNDLVEKVTGWIKDSGGVVDKTDLWGKRKLAYPIQKQNDGQYVLIKTQLEPEFCSQLEHNMGLQESVMRFLLTAVDE
jgi:small subunit ribosomal protein S6